MKLFVKIFNGLKPFTIFDKNFILDVSEGSEYASEWDLRQEKGRKQLFSTLESMLIKIKHVILLNFSLKFNSIYAATYNLGHNILALFNNLADVLIPTSKTTLDI